MGSASSPVRPAGTHSNAEKCTADPSTKKQPTEKQLTAEQPAVKQLTAKQSRDQDPKQRKEEKEKEEYVAKKKGQYQKILAAETRKHYTESLWFQEMNAEVERDYYDPESPRRLKIDEEKKECLQEHKVIPYEHPVFADDQIYVVKDSRKLAEAWNSAKTRCSGRVIRQLSFAPDVYVGDLTIIEHDEHFEDCISDAPLSFRENIHSFVVGSQEQDDEYTKNHITHVGLRELGKLLPNLRILALYGFGSYPYELGEKVFGAITGFKKLESLTISVFPPWMIKRIKRIGRTTRLDVKWALKCGNDSQSLSQRHRRRYTELRGFYCQPKYLYCIHRMMEAQWNKELVWVTPEEQLYFWNGKCVPLAERLKLRGTIDGDVKNEPGIDEPVLGKIKVETSPVIKKETAQETENLGLPARKRIRSDATPVIKEEAEEDDEDMKRPAKKSKKINTSAGSSKR